MNEELYGTEDVWYTPKEYMLQVKEDNILLSKALPSDMLYFRPKEKRHYFDEYTHRLEDPLAKLYELISNDIKLMTGNQGNASNVIVSPTVYEIIAKYSFYHMHVNVYPYLNNSSLNSKLRYFAGWCFNAPAISDSPCITDDYVYYIKDLSRRS